MARAGDDKALPLVSVGSSNDSEIVRQRGMLAAP
jgi:hypothetical protein